MINCPKLPRCSDTDREDFTGFASRDLTEDPNRKVPAKWKGNTSEPRCIFSETIQSVGTSTSPGSQSRRPQSTAVGCEGPWVVDPDAQDAEVPSRRDQTTWTSQDSRKVLSVFPFDGESYFLKAAILAVFYCWNDPVEKTSPVDQDGADAFFSWSTELQTLNFKIFSVSRVYKIFCLFSANKNLAKILCTRCVADHFNH